MIGAEPDPQRTGSIYGPTDRTRRVEAGAGILIGIGLTPLGWSRLFDADASRYANRVVDFDELLGVSANEIAARLMALPDEAAAIAALTDLLEARIGLPGRDDAVIRAIHRQLIAADYDNVADLADTLGMNELDGCTARACAPSAFRPNDCSDASVSCARWMP